MIRMKAITSKLAFLETRAKNENRIEAIMNGQKNNSTKAPPLYYKYSAKDLHVSEESIYLAVKPFPTTVFLSRPTNTTKFPEKSVSV